MLRRFALLLTLALFACGEDPPTLGEPTDTSPKPFEPEALNPDATIDYDLGPEGEVEPPYRPEGNFGESCSSNSDCETNWCVESNQGYICTFECVDACPENFDCRAVGNPNGDVTFLCVPQVQRLCTPCLEDHECAGGTCLTIDGSQQCATSCREDQDCPSGYQCMPDPEEERSGRFCQPLSGSCSCTPPFDGVTRPCENSNEYGTCLGFERCKADEGWVGCTAQEAAPEICDHSDNNCDGEVDEGFQIDGLYLSNEACGSCNTNCADVIRNATETECANEDGVARCRVVTCEPGYSRVSPYTCIPDISSLCQACEGPADCLGEGATCTALADGNFCTRSCDQDQDCANGYVCADTDDQGTQCIPESGSCTCDGTNTNISRACEKTHTPSNPNDPTYTCFGTESCTADGWGGCVWPDDICDGIDNDCDGIVDNDYKTGDKYTHLEHCGSCDTSCRQIAGPHAIPYCDSEPDTPVCAYGCEVGWFDVNGLAVDGCECEFLPGPDLPGDGIDSNCDGVDGEIDAAIFVAKDGDNTASGSIDSPVRSIAVGLALAQSLGKRDVYVATGVYSENIILAEGIGLYGGYSPDFRQRDIVLYETAIMGQEPLASEMGAVTASQLGHDESGPSTILDGFTIFGRNAGNRLGANSYGIYIRKGGKNLRILNNTVYAGAGGSGLPGTRGTDGANGLNGSDGSDAKNLSVIVSCNNAYHNTGGQGGQRQCEGTSVHGGQGGTGSCPLFESNPGSSVAQGKSGQGSGAGTGGAYGWPHLICGNSAGCTVTSYEGVTVTSDFQCGSCSVPRAGKPSNANSGLPGQSGQDGNAGQAGGTTGTMIGGEWQGQAGLSGGNGQHGAGGGGGGAGGGVDVRGTQCSPFRSGGSIIYDIDGDDIGGSGGGGGSGGCRGTGGQGGSPGGGSFALFVLENDATYQPLISGNAFYAGPGGNGGAGGPGGVGGIPGIGGAGGLAGDQLEGDHDAIWCAAGGGHGGNGGRGGHGGGGGGGAGGPSYAIFAEQASSAPSAWKNLNTLEEGIGGRGGEGGSAIDGTLSGATGASGISTPSNF